ncbi:Uncharacterised protein [Mycobacterium tuberculosis]|uniref:Uncharacterized protein n=1 Tax=Mycobacterium tuberculosis TaxID=1773 RepID=A0A916PGW6_MYCTX|nr:Uncharacterised protein [Mycobacterium tuberculosis]
MTQLAQVEHHRICSEAETPDVLADLLDIGGVDLASDGHHCRQVMQVGPNLSATVVNGGISGPRRDAASRF